MENRLNDARTSFSNHAIYDLSLSTLLLRFNDQNYSKYMRIEAKRSPEERAKKEGYVKEEKAKKR
jgi:hypothetical protein